MDALDWWTLIMRRTSFDKTREFAAFIKALHSCPASSAGIERWFSTVGFVWSKNRNRLGVEKAKKLATVYRALRPKDPEPVPEKPVSAPEPADADNDVNDILSDTDVELEDDDFDDALY